MIFDKFFTLVALTALSHALPDNSPLTGRANCNADNCLRNLRDKRYSISASQFCSMWLQKTVTDTLSVTVAQSVTATETPPANTLILSETVTITDTETILTTDYPTAVNTFVKRGGDIPYPPWLTATYPPVRVSSACSCFISSPSAPATITTTLTVATETETATETLLPLTDIVTSVFTATASATVTQVITGPEIPCGAVGCSNAIGFLDTDPSAATVADCKAFCSSNASCQSFQFGETIAGDTGCNIFENQVADSYAIGYSNSPDCNFRFYDARCTV
ncbi:hypothetical protein H072_3954 [Dactylellina haptotyla CBS 200.50]|uniref:Apple domain-containing protein n=1 Tax=Dactylellina haptotyla (strain CBS 200.50) TaxID=1284197 RepID=S8C318_DACHA|nr:hypothetical protein H072_3954 [Dactylellina haptotyla CBS 200.50]